MDRQKQVWRNLRQELDAAISHLDLGASSRHTNGFGQCFWGLQKAKESAETLYRVYGSMIGGFLVAALAHPLNLAELLARMVERSSKRSIQARFMEIDTATQHERITKVAELTSILVSLSNGLGEKPWEQYLVTTPASASGPARSGDQEAASILVTMDVQPPQGSDPKVWGFAFERVAWIDKNEDLHMRAGADRTPGTVVEWIEKYLREAVEPNIPTTFKVYRRGAGYDLQYKIEPVPVQQQIKETTDQLKGDVEVEDLINCPYCSVPLKKDTTWCPSCKNTIT